MDVAEAERTEASKPNKGEGLEWYARVDSNHRPFAPEAKNINNLQASFTENTRLTRIRFGPYLDPKRRNRGELDPGWTLLSTLVIGVLRARARSRRHPENLSKICCSERI
jgi:hypothetical protein